MDKQKGESITMNFVGKNFKKAGIFNLVLICAALALQLYYMVSSPVYKGAMFFDYFYCMVMIAALIFGVFYALSGYKKNGAKYYKAFMYLSLVAFLSVAVDDLLYLDYSAFTAMFGTYANFIRIVPVVLLTFVKDFGKRNSQICAYLQLALSVFIFVRGFILYTQIIPQIVIYGCFLMLSAVMTVFVEEKYIDKDARGTK